MLDAPSYFRTALDAARWIHAQGYVGRRGIVSEHQARREVAKLKADPRHGYPFAVVKKLADKTWGNLKADAIVASDEEELSGNLFDSKERLVAAQARLQELKVKELEGRLVDRAEADKREVAIILGIKSHLETAIPDRAIGLLSGVKALIPAEHHPAIDSHLPEIIEHDREQVADIFDQLARLGGVGEI